MDWSIIGIILRLLDRNDKDDYVRVMAGIDKSAGDRIKRRKQMRDSINRQKEFRMLKVIRFSAPWCGPCMAMDRFWQNIVDRFPNVEFKVVNIDENIDLAQDYNVVSIPMLIFEIDDERRDSVVGLVPEQEIVDRITSLLEVA